MNSVLEKLSPLLFTIALFAFWEAACRVFKIDRFILPAPSEAIVSETCSAASVQSATPLATHCTAPDASTRCA
jgi:ABC-type nitrate/sulfonate/bicarbonate transport system permease component